MLSVTIPFPHCGSKAFKSTESALLRARLSRSKRVTFEIDAKQGAALRAGLSQSALDELSVTTLLFDGGSFSPRRDSPGGLAQKTLDALSVPGTALPSAQTSAAGFAQATIAALTTEEGLSQDILDALCISDGETCCTG